MQFQTLNPMQQYIPVVTGYGGGNSLGQILAASGLQTSCGVVQGFDAVGNIICAGSGIAGMTNFASGVYYGYQLEVLQSDAQHAGWPGRESDVSWQGHSSSTFIFSL